MAFRDDRRGAALQVGAVLLLGFLVVSLSVYQVTVVPARNERVEFRHSQAVQGDLLDLRNALLRAGTAAGVQPVTIDMGTRYASRVLFVNPPAPGGLLETGPERNVTLANVSARNAETRDFLNGSRNYTGRSLSYDPSYNVYGSAPTTTYRSGVVVNEFADGASTARSGQTLVQGNEIYLVAVSGSLSRAQVGSLAVDPRTLSAATRTTTVGNATAGPLTLTVPTTLSADRWRNLLGDQRGAAGHVVGVRDGAEPGTVEIVLEAGESYRLRTALVGVGVGGSAPGPAYLTTAETRPGDDLTLEVRDRFNNPVPNAREPENLTVNATVGRNLVIENRNPVDENGRVGFDYRGNATVDGASDPLDLTLEYDNGTPVDGVDPATNGSVNLTVTDADLPGGTTNGTTGKNEINPGDGVVLESATKGGNKNETLVKFNNTDPDRDRYLIEARIPFYFSEQAQKQADSFDLNGNTIDVGAPISSVGNTTLDAGTSGTEDVTIDFNPNDVQTEGDFFILTAKFKYYEGGEATYVTNDYFIAVKK